MTDFDDDDALRQRAGAIARPGPTTGCMGQDLSYQIAELQHAALAWEPIEVSTTVSVSHREKVDRHIEELVRAGVPLERIQVSTTFQETGNEFIFEATTRVEVK